jgi:heat shock protein HslJ
MRRLIFLTTIMASVFVFNNCNNYKQLTTQTEVLFRNKWKLTEVQGQQVPDSLKSSFEFTPGKISGSAGCNWLSANFFAGKRQTVTFVPDTLIKRTCENENAHTLETTFLDALSKSTKWDLKGGELWLGNGKDILIKLRSL